MFGGDWRRGRGALGAAARRRARPSTAIAQASRAAAATARATACGPGRIGACPGTLELIDLRRGTRRLGRRNTGPRTSRGAAALTPSGGRIAMRGSRIARPQRLRNVRPVSAHETLARSDPVMAGADRATRRAVVRDPPPRSPARRLLRRPAAQRGRPAALGEGRGDDLRPAAGAVRRPHAVARRAARRRPAGELRDDRPLGAQGRVRARPGRATSSRASSSSTASASSPTRR